MKKTIGFVSLGCDKNRVDLEKMMANIKKAGFELVEDFSQANIVLINTCAFILPAREEAVNTILEIADLKRQGKVEKIVVTGCLPEKNYNELVSSLPEIDAFVKLKDNKNIVGIIQKLYNNDNKFKPCEYYERVLSNHSHFAYLKIADGCNNYCSYCTIPRIRGKYTSNPMQEVVREAKHLASLGVKELILVAQDVTRYGQDLYGKIMLVDLLKKLVKIEDIKRIRLLYCYPELVNDELITFVCENEKMCKYFDIPLQHISDSILSSMNRRLAKTDILNLVEKLKNAPQKIAIRSTFIIGYPGEKSKNIKELICFLKKAKLDNVGFFAYSREEGTRAGYMKGQIANFIKQYRLKCVQKAQREVFFDNAKNKIGKIYNVVVDDFDETSGKFLARDEFNSPNVDFYVTIDTDKPISVGDFINVKYTDFDGEYFKGDLV